MRVKKGKVYDSKYITKEIISRGKHHDGKNISRIILKKLCFSKTSLQTIF